MIYREKIKAYAVIPGIGVITNSNYAKEAGIKLKIVFVVKQYLIN